MSRRSGRIRCQRRVPLAGHGPWTHGHSQLPTRVDGRSRNGSDGRWRTSTVPPGLPILHEVHRRNRRLDAIGFVRLPGRRIEARQSAQQQFNIWPSGESCRPSRQFGGRSPDRSQSKSSDNCVCISTCLIRFDRWPTISSTHYPTWWKWTSWGLRPTAARDFWTLSNATRVKWPWCPISPSCWPRPTSPSKLCIWANESPTLSGRRSKDRPTNR